MGSVPKSASVLGCEPCNIIATIDPYKENIPLGKVKILGGPDAGKFTGGERIKITVKDGGKDIYKILHINGNTTYKEFVK